MYDTLDRTNTARDLHAGGAVLGTVERRYGLLRCREQVRIAEELERHPDLAVADRRAWLACRADRRQRVVVSHEQWFKVVVLDGQLDLVQVASLVPEGPDAPRLLSLVSERGITPVVGPLVPVAAG